MPADAPLYSRGDGNTDKYAPGVSSGISREYALSFVSSASRGISGADLEVKFQISKDTYRRTCVCCKLSEAQSCFRSLERSAIRDIITYC